MGLRTRYQSNDRVVSERSFLQWMLIRGLSFGVLNWVVLCALLFLAYPGRSFLSIAGITAFSLGLFFLALIFGVFIYLVSKLLYLRMKKEGKLPYDLRTIENLTWKANAYCLPAIALVSYFGFGLFYDSYDSIASMLSFTNLPTF